MVLCLAARVMPAALWLFACAGLCAGIPEAYRSYYAETAEGYLSPGEAGYLSGTDKGRINELLRQRKAELIRLSDEFDKLYSNWPANCCGKPDHWANRPSRTGAWYLPTELQSSHWGCFSCKRKMGGTTRRPDGKTYSANYEERGRIYSRQIQAIVDQARTSSAAQARGRGAASQAQGSSQVSRQGSQRCPAGNCRLTKDECDASRKQLGALWPCKGGSPLPPPRQPVNPPVQPDPRDNPDEPREGNDVPVRESSPASEPADEGPVTPGEAAGATAAAALVVAIGSFLFTRAMGVQVGDFRDAWEILTGAGTPVPPPPPVPEFHDEGDISPSGEIYSLNRGWLSPDEYQRDLATRALIDGVNRGINRQPDAAAQDLGRGWMDSRRRLEDMRESGRYIDQSIGLAERFGTAEEKAWCLDFIQRHAKAGPDGYGVDAETARQMYSGLKKQMYTSTQLAHMGEAEYQRAVSGEIGRKTEVVVQIRDNANRINRVLARFDPTGTGQKIVGIQQGIYGTIDGYEQGGLAGAAEAAALTLADNYTNGYASANYRAVKDAYAEQGISDMSIAERVARANFETANNKYNALDHAGKAVSHLMDGDYGAAFDSSLDALDARDSVRDDYGKARDWATRPKTDAQDQPQVPVADAAPEPASPGRNLGALRRESFEQTRKSFEDQTRVMQELNRIADIPDPAQRQVELIRIRNEDPSTYNVVQKQLHPDTAKVITETNRKLGEQVVERQAQILREQGFDPEVRLTGKAGGADVDGYWTLRDRDGNIVSDGETRRLAEDALKKASDEVLEPLGTDADKLGHKVMNESPEKFAADPNDLGIDSRDGRLQDGRIEFSDHERQGEHWTDDKGKAALTAPKDRISDAAMTRDNASSLGEVMRTKTGHLDEIARHKGAVTEGDVRDMARELVKTNNRTFLPMAEKAGVKPTAEYRDLMQKLMLVKDGEISSAKLPPRGEMDRIIRENVGRLEDAMIQ